MQHSDFSSRSEFPAFRPRQVPISSADFMQKTALLFAGQGAQVVGMGKDLAERYPTASALFARANEVLGYDLTSICFNGPESELTKTENAQPAIYLHGWITFQLLKEQLPAFRFQ